MYHVTSRFDRLGVFTIPHEYQQRDAVCRYLCANYGLSDDAIANMMMVVDQLGESTITLRAWRGTRIECNEYVTVMRID